LKDFSKILEKKKILFILNRLNALGKKEFKKTKKDKKDKRSQGIVHDKKSMW